MGNIWDHYYRVKIPEVKGISERLNTSVTSLDQVKTDLGAIDTLFNDVMTNLNSTVDSIVNPKFGLVAGLNCLLIGENINTVLDAMCISNFITFYTIRSIMGLTCLIIFFALCCIVCSGVRHFKHFERNAKIDPNLNNKNNFEDSDEVFKH